jgi:hypothetical protein
LAKVQEAISFDFMEAISFGSYASILFKFEYVSNEQNSVVRFFFQDENSKKRVWS